MKALVLAALGLAMAACGGGGGNSQPALPPAPDPPPNLVDQLNFGVTPEIGNRSTVHFVWAGGRYSDRPPLRADTRGKRLRGRPDLT